MNEAHLPTAAGGVCMTGAAVVRTAFIAGSTPCSNIQQLYVHLVCNLQNARAGFIMQLPVTQPPGMRELRR